ncbi:LysR family transcriptional regulator [Acuticoccus sp.]|uniref:LysR family transcriptional regulator n=1 Tax=Acuticoccus sp. TaxID=1904378 RepID=UPI003B51C2F9
MTIRNLRTLIAAAEHGTFTAAAEALGLTHAAVSQQMKALEEELDVPLFDRTRRSPVLTPAGHAVLVRAREIVAAYENLAPSVLGDGHLRGELTLGAVPTTLAGLVPSALARLRADHGDLRVRVVPGLTTALVAEVERSAVDAAIVTRPPLMPRRHDWLAVAREPMELLASPDVASDDPIVLLSSRPYIRFTRQAVVGALIEGWLQDIGVEVVEAMELDNLEVIQSMVYAGLGVSIVPRQCVPSPSALPLKRLALMPPPPSRELGLLWRSDSVKAPALTLLGDTLRRTAEEGVFGAPPATRRRVA